MKKILSRADELVLLTVWKLNNNAYGVVIRKKIIETTNQDWSVGAIYDSLERLSKWEYLKTYQGDPTPERGGRSKRFYKITEEGIDSLNELRQIQKSLWTSLPNFGLETEI